MKRTTAIVLTLAMLFSLLMMGATLGVGILDEPYDEPPFEPFYESADDIIDKELDESLDEPIYDPYYYLFEELIDESAYDIEPFSEVEAFAEIDIEPATGPPVGHILDLSSPPTSGGVWNVSDGVIEYSGVGGLIITGSNPEPHAIVVTNSTRVDIHPGTSINGGSRIALTLPANSFLMGHSSNITISSTTSGIFANGDLSISGAIGNITAGFNGIGADGDITISGIIGNINATMYGIYTQNGNIYINGETTVIGVEHAFFKQPIIGLNNFTATWSNNESGLPIGGSSNNEYVWSQHHKWVRIETVSNPVVTWFIPNTLRVGDYLPDFPSVPNDPNIADCSSIVAIATNLPVRGANNALFLMSLSNDTHNFMFQARGGDQLHIFDDGTSNIIFGGTRVYRPGNFSFQLRQYDLWDDEAGNIGDPFLLTVEEPIIMTNAPQNVVSGQTLNFTTQLANTSLTNGNVAHYENLFSLHEENNVLGGDWELVLYMESRLAFRPTITVIEGQHLVTQSNQNYANTLQTSETLTFNGVGTVRLRVTYNQLSFHTEVASYAEWFAPYAFNPERIITINVVAEMPTNDTTIIDEDPDTGIILEAPPGTVPPDTRLQVTPVTEGGNFTIINNALAQTSEKWVAFDIKLISDSFGEIQPKGNVTITIPREMWQGFNHNKMAVFHIEQDGTYTLIPPWPVRMDSTQDNLIFEWNRFSLFAIAELTDEYIAYLLRGNETAVLAEHNVPQTGDTANLILWISLLSVSALGIVFVTVWQRKRAHNK